MRATEFLLLVLVGWTTVGALGVGVSLMQRQRRKAVRHAAWIVAVWVIYLAVLIGVSLLQPQKFVAAGTPQCYGKMCFTVLGFDEIPGYLLHGSRLVRVKIGIANRGHKPESESRIRAFLISKQGGGWSEVPGLSGVRLTTRVPAGGSTVSEPVFKVDGDAVPEGIVFTHGRWQPGVLVIGDSDSLFHRPTIALLPR
ncbi:MAG: hypothetical protein JSS95_00910 [Acidobacteria bacterium]|nr:hypothetical protein [Acidobacteriota bacterium]